MKMFFLYHIYVGAVGGADDVQHFFRQRRGDVESIDAAANNLLIGPLQLFSLMNT